MPDISTTLRTPNYASAPSSPKVGQIYFDTTNNQPYVWDGTSWKAELTVWYGTTAPSPRGDYVIWIDTT